MGEPVARLGPLGWTCIGHPDGRVESGTRTHTIRTLLTQEAGPVYGAGSCCELDQTLKRFWEIENYGTEPNVSIVCTEEEKLALEKVSSYITIMGDTVSQCHGQNRGHNCQTIDKWQNPDFVPPRKT